MKKKKKISGALTRPIRLFKVQNYISNLDEQELLIQNNVDHTDEFWTLKCL